MRRRLRCMSCPAEIEVRRGQGGASVRCAACDAAIQVPRSLGLGDDLRSDLAEGRADRRVLVFAWVSLALYLVPPVSALTWWVAAGRIARHADQGRSPPEALFEARTIAAATFVGQMASAAAIVVRLL